MRAAILSNFDPWDEASWSGCSRNLLNSLRDQNGWDIHAVGPIGNDILPISVGQKIRAKFHRLQGRNYLHNLMPDRHRRYAEIAHSRLAEIKPEIILALDGHLVRYLETDTPLYHFWDCTFAGNLSYPWFADLAAPCIASGHDMSRIAYSKARISFFPSNWALDSAERDYGVPNNRLGVAKLGANLSPVWPIDKVESAIANRSEEAIHLLFIGIDWLRKGGDLAVEVVQELNRRGQKAHLHVVGTAPDNPDDLPDCVTLHGFLRKSDQHERAQLEQLLGAAHFLLVPSLAEAFGAVFAEASIFGVPSLARRVGGIDAAVEEGVNGYLFNANAPAGDYCDRIQTLSSDRDTYKTLARNCRRHFDSHLSWDAAAASLDRQIRSDLQKSH